MLEPVSLDESRLLAHREGAADYLDAVCRTLEASRCRSPAALQYLRRLRDDVDVAVDGLGTEARDAVVALFWIRASSVLATFGHFRPAWAAVIRAERLARRRSEIARVAGRKALLAADEKGLSYEQRATWRYAERMASDAARDDLAALYRLNGYWVDSAADAPADAAAQAERELSGLDLPEQYRVRAQWLRARLRISKGDSSASFQLDDVASHFSPDQPEAIGIQIDRARAAVLRGDRSSAVVHLGTAWPMLVAQNAPPWAWAWWRDLARQVERAAVEPASFAGFQGALKWLHLEQPPVGRLAVAGG